MHSTTHGATLQGALYALGYESPAGLALIELCYSLVHASTVKTAEQVKRPPNPSRQGCSLVDHCVTRRRLVHSPETVQGRDAVEEICAPPPAEPSRFELFAGEGGIR